MDKNKNQGGRVDNDIWWSIKGLLGSSALDLGLVVLKHARFDTFNHDSWF